MTKREKIVVICFAVLIAFCSLLVAASGFLEPFSGKGLADTGVEGLKVSISALVGALSAIMGGKR